MSEVVLTVNGNKGIFKEPTGSGIQINTTSFNTNLGTNNDTTEWSLKSENNTELLKLEADPASKYITLYSNKYRITDAIIAFYDYTASMQQFALSSNQSTILMFDQEPTVITADSDFEKGLDNGGANNGLKYKGQDDLHANLLITVTLAKDTTDVYILESFIVINGLPQGGNYVASYLPRCQTNGTGSTTCITMNRTATLSQNDTINIGFRNINAGGLSKNINILHMQIQLTPL